MLHLHLLRAVIKRFGGNANHAAADGKLKFIVALQETAVLFAKAQKLANRRENQQKEIVCRKRALK